MVYKKARCQHGPRLVHSPAPTSYSYLLSFPPATLPWERDTFSPWETRHVHAPMAGLAAPSVWKAILSPHLATLLSISLKNYLILYYGI